MFCRISLIFIAAVLTIGTSAMAASSSPRTSRSSFLGGSRKKAEAGENVHWTLADWMSQKSDFRMMDQWLAMNRTIDSFELNLSGGNRDYDRTIAGVKRARSIEHYGVSFYWSIFGIEYEFENSNEHFKRESVQADLRVFGTSSQSTNLTGFYGVRRWREESPSNVVDNPYGGVKLTLYIFDFFGVDGEYKSYSEAKAGDKTKFSGFRAQYGAFFEIGVVRLYGQAFKETTYKNPADPVTDPPTIERRNGTEFGVRFYF